MIYRSVRAAALALPFLLYLLPTSASSQQKDEPETRDAAGES